jgi:hypothetical protein
MMKSIGLVVWLTMVACPAAFAGEDICVSFNEVPCLTAPEIDPTSANTALTLLVGGIAVLVGRRSKRSQGQA